MIGADVVDGLPDLGIIERPVFVAEQFEDAGGDVGALRIEHRVVISEWDLLENILGAILVEGAPPAVFALESHHPVEATFQGGVTQFGFGCWDEAQGQQYHGGVVDVGVPLVFELERPAAGFDCRGILVLPVAAEPDLLGQHPLASLRDGRVVRGDARFAEADQHDGGIPDWGEARFDMDRVAGFVFQLFQFPFGAEDFRVIVGIAQRFEGDERVEHGREDGGQAIGTLEAFEHPLFGFSKRPFAERAEAVVFDKLVEAIEPEEKIAPGQALGIRGQSEVTFVIALGIKLIEGHRWIQRPGGLEMIDDGQGDEHGPRP